MSHFVLTYKDCETPILEMFISSFLALQNWKDKVKWLVKPAGIYLLKINNRNTRTRCEIVQS